MTFLIFSSSGKASSFPSERTFVRAGKLQAKSLQLTACSL